MPRFLTLALGLALALAAAPPALAVPPANDNYLGSIGVTASQTVDTTEATTQADLFDPNRDGLPFGGSGPEPLSCPVAPSYGKTVWYDFKPPAPGGIRIATTGAFDNVIAVYEWTEATSQLGRLVACVNATAGVSEELLMALRERNYTMQFGGVGGAGGALNFTFEYFQDTDGDTVLDEDPDKCLRLRGIRDFGGCPPVVRGAPRLTATGTGAGVRVDKLTVDRAERGTRIEVRCRALRRDAARAGQARGHRPPARLRGPVDPGRRPPRGAPDPSEHELGPLPLRRHRQDRALADHEHRARRVQGQLHAAGVAEGDPLPVRRAALAGLVVALTLLLAAPAARGPRPRRRPS